MGGAGVPRPGVGGLMLVKLVAGERREVCTYDVMVSNAGV